MRPLLIALGWLVFSTVYGFGAMALTLGIFGSQGSFSTLAALLAALLLWGYFTVYLVTASNRRHADPSPDRSEASRADNQHR